MIEKDRLIRTFCELVKIDSPSGEEGEISRHLTQKLSNLGFNVVKDNYGNLIASEEGSDPLMLSAHMDTVEPGRNINPKVLNDRIVSDGTTILGGDCKAGIAAIIEGVESVLEEGIPRRPIQIVLTREEEVGLVGALNLDYSQITAKKAVVFDGNGPVNTITGASPTYIRFDVKVKGIGAHAGVEPEKGLSAIKIATDMISDLPQGRLDEETTFNVGLIEGGTVRNAVPVQANFGGEFRSRSSETLDLLQLQIKNTVQKYQEKYKKSKIDYELETMFHMFKLDVTTNVAVSVFNILDDMGLEPIIKPSGGGTDANIMLFNGIDCIVVGMATNKMHTVDEYVVTKDLIQTAQLCHGLLKKAE